MLSHVLGDLSDSHSEQSINHNVQSDSDQISTGSGSTGSTVIYEQNKYGELIKGQQVAPANRSSLNQTIYPSEEDCKLHGKQRLSLKSKIPVRSEYIHAAEFKRPSEYENMTRRNVHSAGNNQIHNMKPGKSMMKPGSPSTDGKSSVRIRPEDNIYFESMSPGESPSESSDYDDTIFRSTRGRVPPRPSTDSGYGPSSHDSSNSYGQLYIITSPSAYCR